MICLNCFRDIPDNSRGCRLCGVNFDQWASGKSSPRAKAKAKEQKGARGRTSKPAHPQRQREVEEVEEARPRRSWKRRLAVVPALGVLAWLGGWAAAPAMDQIASRGTLVYVSSQDRKLYAQAPGGEPVRLADHPATPEHGTLPTLSRDGRRVAFVSGPRGARAIHVVGSDGSGSTRLSPPDTDAGQPVWSPDGSRLAFTCRPAGLLPHEQTVDGRPLSELVVVRADGSRLVKVTHDAAFHSSPVWSPGGTKLAFGSAGGGWFTVMADGGERAPLNLGTAGELEAWSPDGSRIALVAGDGLYVANADGSQTRRVSDSTIDGHYLDVSWSPDGERLAGFRHRHGVSSMEIAIVRADGGGTEQAVPAEEGGFAWGSADHVVFIGRPEAGRSWLSIKTYSGAPQACVRSVHRGAARWLGPLNSATAWALTTIARTPPVDPATTVLTESGVLAVDWAPGPS